MKIKLGRVTCQFYRGIYGGQHWLPYYYWSRYYKEFGWLLWLFSVEKEEE